MSPKLTGNMMNQAQWDASTRPADGRNTPPAPYLHHRANLLGQPPVTLADLTKLRLLKGVLLHA
jgi:hypothetical protein